MNCEKYKRTEALFTKIWTSLVASADTDHDGKISSAEWLLLWESYKKELVVPAQAYRLLRQGALEAEFTFTEWVGKKKAQQLNAKLTDLLANHRVGEIHQRFLLLLPLPRAGTDRTGRLTANNCDSSAS